MPILHTTLNLIHEHTPCRAGWRRLLKHLGKTNPDDAPLPLAVILDSNGLDDTLWCLRAVIDVEQHAPALRLYAVWCARQVQHLMNDPRSLAALDVAERHAWGEATDVELLAARIAARIAARSAVVWDAARAAESMTLNNAWATAWRSARDAVEAARDAAWDAAEAAQIEEFKRRFCA